jgi:hypothetical protein
MPNVVTPFSRKHRTRSRPTSSTPRHRREGYFDEHDQWHNSTETIEPASKQSGS